MRRIVFLLALLSAALLLIAADQPANDGKPADDPRFTADGKLIRPQNYREWVYLSSGLGMSYSAGAADPNPQFTNVFVKPESYREFLKTGAWPDKTVFVLEERASSSKGSINQHGHFQTDLAGLVSEVKDEKRFPEKWAFFALGETQNGNLKLLESGEAFNKSMCLACHTKHGAVDNTFVQFYPTLKAVAEAKGTYKPKE